MASLAPYVFVFLVLCLGSLLFGIAISIRWPERRIWPPRENPGFFLRLVGRLNGFGVSLGVPVVALFDWNSFVLEHPARFLLAALLIASGFGAKRAHQFLGSAESVARAPAGGELVLRTDGPYALTRNPQYVGAIAGYSGVAIAANSDLALITAGVVSACLALFPFAEEPWLRERFGQPFVEYCERVPRYLPRRAARMLMMLCLAVLAGDFAITLLPSVVYPGYDPVAQFMSELGVPGRPGHDALILWWPFYGACLIGMGGLWASELESTGFRRWLGPALLGVTGIGLGIVSGFHPCDEGCAGTSVSNTIHQASGLLGLLALTASPFGFAAAFRGFERWRGLAPLSLAAGIGAVVFLVLQMASAAPDSAGSAYRGLVQRAALLWSYLWLLAIGLRWLGTVDPDLD